MWLPSKGCVLASTKNMRNPHKIGRVMWADTICGNTAPLDLHNRILMKDESNLHEVGLTLMATRKTVPILHMIKNMTWDRMDLIKPYLMASLDTRAEARSMMASGDWDPFWRSL